jgi:hypothetical protein
VKDFLTTFGTLVSGGAFSGTTGKNASGASAVDGTPFCADFINDIWAWKERLLYLAGITPSGASDTYAVSDVVTSLQRVIRGPGEYVMSALNAAELALRRLLPLTGQVILISNYPDLANETYVGDVNNAAATAFFKCNADGVTHNTAGLYFKLPDGRGLFLQGTGTNVAYLAGDGNGFTGPTLPGAFSQDTMQNFKIPTGVAGSGSYAGYGSSQTGGTTPAANGAGPPRLGPSTKPASIGGQICISY